MEEKNNDLKPTDVPYRAHLLLKFEYGEISKDDKIKLDTPLRSKLYILEAESKEQLLSKIEKIKCMLTNFCKCDSIESGT